MEDGEVTDNTASGVVAQDTGFGGDPVINDGVFGEIFRIVEGGFCAETADYTTGS